MPERIIYVFNPEADYALAEYKESYTPPATVVSMRKALALHQLRYVRPKDFLLLLDKPSQDASDIYDERCVFSDDAKDFFKEVAGHPYDFVIRPWNWTPDLVRKLRRWGVTETLLPDKDRLDLIRRLSDRTTTIEFNRELNRSLKVRGMDYHISPIPERFENVDDALKWRNKVGKVFFKYPWSSSGRGVLLADDSLSDEKLRQWLSGGLRRQGHIMGEQFFTDKTTDFATEWEIRDGEASFLGVSLFHVSEDGRYLGNDIKKQSEIRKEINNCNPDFTIDFIEAQKEALENIIGNYSGFVGIDMMANSEGRIRGGVELNFRMTMGIAAMLENNLKSNCDNRGITSKVLIIGKGNVGSHLANALFLAGIDVELHSSRDNDYSLRNVTHVIIAVKDSAIPEVADAIGLKLASLKYTVPPIITHTSGSVSISVLAKALPEGTHYGVFYPMQTFTRGIKMDYSSIPFLLEGSDAQALRNLKDLALLISRNVIEADSDIRSAYHIGAVLTCNFANHLCCLASDYLSSQGLDFKILQPLLEQTIAKLRTSTPQSAQTGPAARGDKNVIDYHLRKLEDSHHIAEIYRLLSKSITDYTNQKK